MQGRARRPGSEESEAFSSGVESEDGYLGAAVVGRKTIVEYSGLYLDDVNALVLLNQGTSCITSPNTINHKAGQTLLIPPPVKLASQGWFRSMSSIPAATAPRPLVLYWARVEIG